MCGGASAVTIGRALNNRGQEIGRVAGTAENPILGITGPRKGEYVPPPRIYSGVSLTSSATGGLRGQIARSRAREREANAAMRRINAGSPAKSGSGRTKKNRITRISG